MLKEALTALAADDKDKVTQILKQLETAEKKEKKLKRRQKVSQTSRKVNRLKQKIEKIKADLAEHTGGIQFSGFFDVGASGYVNEPNIFTLGDFELDMEKAMGDHFQVASALVFNDDGAELAVGFIDFHIFGGTVAARGRLFTQKGLHFQVGRFDIPFGNDWLYYASVDRVSVSAPLTTQLVMDGGYNDVGFRLLRSALHFNYTVFMLRGIEEGFSFGGRFGFTPFNNPYTLKEQDSQLLEIGFSYMHDINRDGNREERALAIDLEGRLGPLRLQGEWIHRDNYLDGLHREGYHVSAFLDAGEIAKQPFVFYSRFDFFREKPHHAPSADHISRLTAGVNVSIMDIVLLKTEYTHFLREQETFMGNSFYAQLVITF